MCDCPLEKLNKQTKKPPKADFHAPPSWDLQGNSTCSMDERELMDGWGAV